MTPRFIYYVVAQVALTLFGMSLIIIVLIPATPQFDLTFQVFCDACQMIPICMYVKHRGKCYRK